MKINSERQSFLKDASFLYFHAVFLGYDIRNISDFKLFYKKILRIKAKIKNIYIYTFSLLKIYKSKGYTTEQI